MLLCIFFFNEFINYICVYAFERNLFQLAFQLLHKVIIKRHVHYQYIVVSFIGGLYIAMLTFRVLGVEINSGTIFIGLKIFHFGIVFIQCEVFVLSGSEQYKI